MWEHGKPVTGSHIKQRKYRSTVLSGSSFGIHVLKKEPMGKAESPPSVSASGSLSLPKAFFRFKAAFSLAVTKRRSTKFFFVLVCTTRSIPEGTPDWSSAIWILFFVVPEELIGVGWW
jgi:hypothetical protein